jgi:hypothetical protein
MQLLVRKKKQARPSDYNNCLAIRSPEVLRKFLPEPQKRSSLGFKVVWHERMATSEFCTSYT